MALFGQGGFIVQKFEGQEDPYIYNTGNSAFNLGYTHNSATKLELTCAAVPRNNYETVIGARNYSYQASAMAFFSKYNGFRPCYARTGQEATGDYDSNTSSTSTMWYGQKVRIVMEGQSCLMENLETGAVHSITASSSTVDSGIAPLALFCQNNSTSSGGWDPFDFGYMVFFRLKIWENGELLHDFVPAYSNSQYCIYDNIDGVYKYEIYASGAYMLGRLNFIREEAEGGVEVLKDGLISNGSTQQYLTATFENVSVYKTLYLTFNYNNVDQYYIMPIEVSSIGSGLSTSVYLSPANLWLYFTITNTSITATYYAGSWRDIYVTIVAVRDVPTTVCQKKITDNGTYVAVNDGYAGYSSIEVNVAGGGGGGIPTSVTDLISYQVNDNNMIFDNEYSSQFRAYYATQNELGTYYWISANPTNSYIGYKFSTPIAVNGYEIVTRNTGSSYDYSQAPKQWKIQGSNDDGATWTDIHSGSHTFTFGGEHYSDAFDNELSYKWWRIFIITATQTDEGTAIGYFQFKRIEVANPVLGTKIITQNGTYEAEADNLKGYSNVTVEVGTFNILHAESKNREGGASLSYTFAKSGLFQYLVLLTNDSTPTSSELTIQLSGTTQTPTSGGSGGTYCFFYGNLVANSGDNLSVTVTSVANRGAQLFVLENADINNFSFIGFVGNDSSEFNISGSSDAQIIEAYRYGYYSGNNSFNYTTFTLDSNTSTISIPTPNNSQYWYGGTWAISFGILSSSSTPSIERLFYFEGVQSDSVQIPPATILDEDTNFSEYLSYDTTTKKFTVLKAFSAMVTGWVYQFQNAGSRGTGQFVVNDIAEMNYQVPSTSAGSKDGRTGVFDFAVGDTFWSYQNSSNGWPQQFLKVYLIKNIDISGVIEWDDETA